MSKTTIEAAKVNNLIIQGIPIEQIIAENSYDTTKWYNISAKAYSINIEHEKRKRKENENKLHVATTSQNEMIQIISLNEKLANYALLLPVISTMGDFNHVNNLISHFPSSERKIIQHLGGIEMAPLFRARQKKGRFEKFEYFSPFLKVIDAAILSYYRENYISCYFTLMPVIEGIIIRWMGYKESDKKPDFENVRNFFRNSHVRQPSPWNIQFHQIYVNACNKILNEHFYKPTDIGQAHADFNRHVASHLLNDNHFATHDNCIRLFILLDAMAEIYFYESRKRDDPRFNLHFNDTYKDMTAYGLAKLSTSQSSPELLLLNT